MAILGRVLEAAGFRVAILSQPDWRSAEPWRQFGRPRLFFGISAGNMDSMINHYTANKKVRNDDAYTPGGRIGLRPDRATLPYCQRAREAFPGVPVIAGGVEASLRRLAHYDYWSDTVQRSILLDSKADLVVFGMGEQPIVEIARRLAAGRDRARPARHARASPTRSGPRKTPPADAIVLPSLRGGEDRQAQVRRGDPDHPPGHQPAQRQAARAVPRPPGRRRATRPRCRSARRTWTGSTACPTPAGRTRCTGEPIPAFEMIKDSVTIMRGCFGGCTFCSITAHQGRIIQSRSQESVLGELQPDGAGPEFSGVVTDIGGPTANMYQMRCTRPEVEAKCKRLSCVHPKVCKLLGTDHGPLVELMQREPRGPGHRQGAGRLRHPHGPGPAVARVPGGAGRAPRRRPSEGRPRAHRPRSPQADEEARDQRLRGLRRGLPARRARKAGKPKQYLVPYFIASHPGSDLHAMIDLALFLKRNGYRPDQVQDFIPAPFDIATCMYYTGIDPFTGEEVYTAKHLRDRKLQRALLQFFKPENYFEVREALIEGGPAGPDRLGLRRPDPGPAAQGRAPGPDGEGQQGR